MLLLAVVRISFVDKLSLIPYGIPDNKLSVTSVPLASSIIVTNEFVFSCASLHLSSDSLIRVSLVVVLFIIICSLNEAAKV